MIEIIIRKLSIIFFLMIITLTITDVCNFHYVVSNPDITLVSVNWYSD